MSATPLSNITSDCKSSNRRPLEKKSEKSKESLLGIDDMLKRPKTCPMACVPLSSSLICPFFIVKLRSPEAFKNEKSSINFWSTSGMMAPFYEVLRVMTDWLVKRGVKRNNAQKYITSLFLALSQDAVENSKENLKNLVKESQTPKGLNEQGVKELTKAGFYKSLEKTLNSIHRRLNK